MISRARLPAVRRALGGHPSAETGEPWAVAVAVAVGEGRWIAS
ncbi:hypothetical protein AB0937_06465 [Streptomyces sp. NPDC047880]